MASIGGQVGWTTLSDGRYKTDVRENVPGLSFITQLLPVTYHLNVEALQNTLQESRSESESVRGPQKSDMTFTGFIAQEVEQAAMASDYNFSGVDAPKNASDLYGLRNAEFVVPLVKAAQELAGRNDHLNDLLGEQQMIIESLQSENAAMKSQLDALSSLQAEVAELKALMTTEGSE